MQLHVSFFCDAQEIGTLYANNIQLENRKNTTGYALEKENTYGTV